MWPQAIINQPMLSNGGTGIVINHVGHFLQWMSSQLSRLKIDDCPAFVIIMSKDARLAGYCEAVKPTNGRTDGRQRMTCPALHFSDSGVLDSELGNDQISDGHNERLWYNERVLESGRRQTKNSIIKKCPHSYCWVNWFKLQNQSIFSQLHRPWRLMLQCCAVCRL